MRMAEKTAVAAPISGGWDDFLLNDCAFVSAPIGVGTKETRRSKLKF